MKMTDPKETERALEFYRNNYDQTSPYVAHGKLSDWQRP
jgi:hypothetical protein